MDFSAPLAAQPTVFAVSNPPRLALDFSGVTNALGETQREVKDGDLTSLNFISAGNRTRILLNLVRAMQHDLRVDGNSLYVTLNPVAGAGAQEKSSPFVSEKIAGQHAVRDVFFRRGKDGEGRVVVDLSDTGVGIDIRQQGRNLVVDFLKTDLPASLRRKMDVTDFATPVTQVTTESRGGNVRLTITPKGSWEHNAYQSENQFVVEVKAVLEDPNKLVQSSKIGYQGPRISVNYQNGDVRGLLKLMAEELGFNAVISESVTGATTLVLKDVPADQVIDIIFQQKGLDMRKSGNVVLIAPRDEIDAREKLKYESQQTKEDLEPLVTETFQLNYHDVKAFEKIFSNKENTLLSKRGKVTMDDRSNIMFVQDVPSRLDMMRRIIATIDTPKRQVMIEARIVEATDWFGKSLGVRLGLWHNKNYTGGGIGMSMGGTTSDGGVTIGNDQNAHGSYPARLANSDGDLINQVNLPAGSVSGALSGATSAQPTTFDFLIGNRKMSRLMNLEISAIEADNKGRVVSAPRILTSDQQEALIEQGVEIPYQEASSSGATSVSFKKAVMSLRVTPQITPDGRISMKINVNQDSKGADVPGGVSINTKKIETTALVENGGTIVIGGIYEMATGNKTDQVPLLGDIPLFGNLFKTKTENVDKRELLVFITPRIVSESLSVSN
ncbi:MAG: type IV pilus secretin PilQ [Zoogloeaceae bacterium]|nr:type IV pilus secretin PilQ [Zoogloeaceae bacterium]